MAATDAPVVRGSCGRAAAGVSARDVPKQYLPLAGKPHARCTRWSGSPRAREIAGLMVVLADGDAYWPALASVRGKPVRTAIGAAERSGSVLAGLRALPRCRSADDFVLVHDAARPCVAADGCRDARSRAALPAGGALLAAPLRDTLKRADADAPRRRDRAARSALARTDAAAVPPRRADARAGSGASADGIAVTDEAMAMERAGHRPLLVEGAEDNIKVTTPADLALAEFLLGRQG